MQSLKFIHKLNSKNACPFDVRARKAKKSYQQSRKRWAINLMTPVNNLLSASFSVTLAIISLFVCLFIFLFTWHQSTTFEFVYMCVYSFSFYNLLFIESRNFEMKPQLLLLLTLNSPHSFFLHLEQRKKNVLFNFGVKIAIAKVIDHQKMSLVLLTDCLP